MANGELISSFDVKRKEFTSSEINLITKLECLQVIRQTLNLDSFEVIDYTIENAGREVLGFLGEYFRLKITIKNETGELTNKYYFVKSLPIHNKESRELIEKMGQFKKESTIYSDLFTQVCNGTNWRPECFLVREDLIIFIELRHLGYRHVGDRAEFDDYHIESALTSLARMHASCFNYEINTLKGRRIIDVHNTIFFETLLPTNGWLMAGLRASQAVAINHPKYGEAYRDKIQSSFLDFEMKLFELLQTSTEYRNIFCHRDLWLNNLMFKYRDSGQNIPEHCLILDYQNVFYAPPALDFVILIYLNTDRAIRDAKLMSYQKFYYEQLRIELRAFGIKVEDVLTESEFLKTCRIYKLVALILSAVYVQLTHLPAGVLKELEKTNVTRYNFICETDRSDFVVDQTRKSEYYGLFLNERVGELIEEFLLQL